MAVNKVIYNTAQGEEVLMDLTSDTVTPETLAEGVTAHDASGNAIVGTMSAGAEPVEEKDVNFYDYDGTLLYSYTLAEAQALTELPPAPKQPGLIFQEWNWALGDIKAHNRKVNVGANYITDDGKTRLYIELPSDHTLDVSVLLNTTVANGVVVDWGDGSATEPVPTKGDTTISHTYPNAGRYVIALEVVSGTLALGDGNTAGCLVVSGNKTSGLRKVETGNGIIKLRAYVFRGMTNLRLSVSKYIQEIGAFSFMQSGIEFIVIPKNATILLYAFYGNRALKVCCFPSTLSGVLPSYLFHAGDAMKSVTIPDGVTGIEANCFWECYGLTEMTIPKDVVSIKANAFAHCNRLLVLRFMPEVPPVVENANAFLNFPTTCVVEVPAGSLEAYKNATNYGTIAAQMVGV